MDVLEENTLAKESLSVDQEIKEFILQIAKWAKFLSIVGFVMIGLMLLGGISIMSVGSAVSKFSRTPTVLPMASLGLIYFVGAVIYFFPVYYLFKAAVGLKTGVNSDNQTNFRSGFKYLKSHYKFIGISTIVVLSLYVVIMIVAITFAGAMASSMR